MFAHAALTDLVAGQPVAVPYGWAAFVVYQVLVSVPFAIGFWWLHENFAPRWWFHIRERNPVADHFIRVQLQYAGAAEEEKAQRRERAKARRAPRPVGSRRTAASCARRWRAPASAKNRSSAPNRTGGGRRSEAYDH